MGYARATSSDWAIALKGMFCRAPGCEWPSLPQRRLCAAHHTRLQNFGTFQPQKPIVRRKPPPVPEGLRRLDLEFRYAFAADPEILQAMAEDAAKLKRLRSGAGKVETDTPG